MKNLFLLLILTFSIKGFSQEDPKNIYSRFSAKNGTIFWENTFEADSTKAITFFRENLKFPSEKKGVISKQKADCKSIAMYMYGNLNFTYKIEYSQNSYKVTISEIMFESTMQYNFGMISAGTSSIRMEEAELRNRDKTLRKNSQSYTNQSCLDDLFIQTFTIN
jgi:uncharacterized protein YueI